MVCPSASLMMVAEEVRGAVAIAGRAWHSLFAAGLAIAFLCLWNL